jgi:nucleoside-diphosphate-sugar epimerase
MKTVLILGANGRFGQAAVQAFSAAGWRVLAQMRRAPVAPLPAGARAMPVALSDTAALAAQAAGASVVVYAVNPAYWRWEQDLMPFFHQGLDVAKHLGAGFMLPGNVYNYGAGMPPVLHEHTPQQPSHRKGELRIAMEDELAALAGQGLNSVLIRAGDFYGSGRGTWLDEAIVKDLARGKLVYPGPLDLAHAWAYLPDLARAFVAVAERGVPVGFTRAHFAGDTLTGHQLLAAIEEAAARLGQRPAQGFRVGGLPWGVIRAVGLVKPMWRELARMSYLWRVPHALAGRTLAQLAGPLHHTPVVDAIEQTLRDFGLAAAPAAGSARTA